MGWPEDFEFFSSRFDSRFEHQKSNFEFIWLPHANFFDIGADRLDLPSHVNDASSHSLAQFLSCVPADDDRSALHTEPTQRTCVPTYHDICTLHAQRDTRACVSVDGNKPSLTERRHSGSRIAVDKQGAGMDRMSQVVSCVALDDSFGFSKAHEAKVADTAQNFDVPPQSIAVEQIGQGLCATDFNLMLYPAVESSQCFASWLESMGGNFQTYCCRQDEGLGGRTREWMK